MSRSKDEGSEATKNGTYSLVLIVRECLSSLRVNASRLLLHGFHHFFYLAQRGNGVCLHGDERDELLDEKVDI